MNLILRWMLNYDWNENFAIPHIFFSTMKDAISKMINCELKAYSVTLPATMISQVTTLK